MSGGAGGVQIFFLVLFHLNNGVIGGVVDDEIPQIDLADLFTYLFILSDIVHIQPIDLGPSSLHVTLSITAPYG